MGQVGVLDAAAGESLVDLLAVGLVDVGAGGLLFEMVDAERHDREAVDRGAGRFGVEAGAGLRLDAGGGKGCGERFVEPFDGVVALLVVAVDRPLDLGDALVADVGAAGDVFLVPEEVVVLVLLADGGEEAGVQVLSQGLLLTLLLESGGGGAACQRQTVSRWRSVIWGTNCWAGTNDMPGFLAANSAAGGEESGGWGGGF